MPGVTVTVTGTGLQLPRVAVTTETGRLSVPEHSDRHLRGDVRAPGLQEGHPPEHPDRHRLQRADRPGAGGRRDDGGSHGVGRVAGRRHQADDRRARTFDVQTLENIPTARDPWMIIYMAPGVQLSGTNVGGSGLGRAADDLVARHQRQRAVEPRRRARRPTCAAIRRRRTTTSTRSSRSR